MMKNPPDLPLEFSKIEDYVMVGLLAAVQVNARNSSSAQVSFREIRNSSGLLPEVLVRMIDFLKSDGHLTVQEDVNGNPYGLLSVSPKGANILSSFGPDARQLLSRAPESYYSSSPERSSRHGGRKDDS